MENSASLSVPASQFNARLMRMYAAISASNEAILRAKTADELFRWVCDAAVHGSDFSNTTIFLVGTGSEWVRAAYSTGVSSAVVRAAPISVDAAKPEGLGMIGTAIRTLAPSVFNDYFAEERLSPWYPQARQAGWHSCGAFPLIVQGACIGVLAFYATDKDTFDQEIIRLLQRVAENVSFALENFHREEQLRASEARFRSLTQLSSDWYWELDTQFCVSRIEGSPLHTMETMDFGGHVGLPRWESGWQAEEGWEAHRAALEAHRPFRDTVLYKANPDGTKYYIAITGEPVYEDGHFAGYRGVGRNVTAQKESEERIRYLAHHDGLTGLPNRLMFSRLLQHSIDLASRYKRAFGVLFFDLDRFKVINDTLGHAAGDALLTEVAQRVSSELRASDVVARLGGDEFVVLVQEIAGNEQIASIARKILAAVSKPVVLNGQECRVTASIGIALCPENGSDEQMLMKAADIAMYSAKERGKNNFQFFSDTLEPVSLARLTLEASLRQAVEQQEFFLEYQPKLDLAAGTITGVEALVRWRHPEQGVVMPNHFIGLAEETGLILAIGKWVIFEACRQNVCWQAEGLPPVRVAVNLSARQFFDHSLVNDVRDVLRDTGLDPALLELEITEGMAMQNIDNAIRVLSALKEMGVRIALDDFGTGYSSLAQIKRFPIDIIKVDRSFIRDLDKNREDRAITEAIIAMGRTLSLTVVAEGVETQMQETFLRERACHESQGYFFSRPTTPEKFAALLRQHVPGKPNVV